THPYRQQYIQETFGKGAAARVGGVAVFRQAINSPSQWGRGAAGFGKRLASGAAAHVVKNSIQFTVGAIRHEDLVYHRSTDTWCVSSGRTISGFSRVRQPAGSSDMPPERPLPRSWRQRSCANSAHSRLLCRSGETASRR